MCVEVCFWLEKKTFRGQTDAKQMLRMKSKQKLSKTNISVDIFRKWSLTVLLQLSPKQKCQMSGGYPFNQFCNINRGAWGAMRHHNFVKVTLTRWRLAREGGPHIYLLHWRRCFTPDGCLPQTPLLFCFCFPEHTLMPSCVCHPTSATDMLLFCSIPLGPCCLVSSKLN